jgi:hypothetical protein
LNFKKKLLTKQKVSSKTLKLLVKKKMMTLAQQKTKVFVVLIVKERAAAEIKSIVYLFILVQA